MHANKLIINQLCLPHRTKKQKLTKRTLLKTSLSRRNPKPVRHPCKQSVRYQQYKVENINRMVRFEACSESEGVMDSESGQNESVMCKTKNK